MKRIIENKRTKDFAGMAVALALIMLSAIMIGITFSQFSNANKESRNQQLESVETSIDYNINDTITRFGRQMDYVLSSTRFSRGLESYSQTGSAGGSLTDIMSNSSLSNFTAFEAMFLEKDGEVIATSVEDVTYEIGKKIDNGLYECRDSGGDEYLAIKRDVGDGYECYGIINIQAMFKSVRQRTNTESGQIMLYLASGDMLFYESNDSVRMCKSSEIAAATNIDVEEAGLLCESEEEGTVITEDYTKGGDKSKQARLRIRAVPSKETENKALAIAVVNDYSAMSALMRSTATKLILFFIIAAAGIVMLVLFLIKSRRERTQADIELERLKEKNKQMEELNDKLRELEHHQRLETIGTMTSGIAHEFNNLLAPIMGYSIMTLEKLDPEDDEMLYDGVLEIYNASKKAKDIISRLSDLARKNTEKVFVRMAPDDMFNRTIKVTSPSMPNNVDMFREFSCSGRYIKGNETQLSQLIINLIINAFQALKDEGGIVTVGTEARDGYIVFFVKDDGPGIPEDIKESIFDPFFTTKEAGAGTGLGLAIVMQAAEDHGGWVELESEEGKGSCFKVYIPEDTSGEAEA